MNELLFLLIGLACFAAVGGLTLGCAALMPARPAASPQLEPEPQRPADTKSPLRQQAGVL